MTNINHRAKFERTDNQIWKRTVVDSQGRVTLPTKLRRKLGVSLNSEILWIDIKHKNGKANDFLIEVGVKK